MRSDHKVIFVIWPFCFVGNKKTAQKGGTSSCEFKSCAPKQKKKMTASLACLEDKKKYIGLFLRSKELLLKKSR
ncbi:hypothetical protein BU015_10760 [Staphylococcus simulans]|nr:hypothetical protein BU015_10760 [Staphylococcus simulans]